MKTLKTLVWTAALCGSVVFASEARADGVVVNPGSMPASEADALKAQIDAEHASNPAAFDAVRNVKGHRPEVYRNNRNPYPTTSRELRGLGASALLPMLEALAFDAPARGSLTDAEWDALAIGLL